MRDRTVLRSLLFTSTVGALLAPFAPAAAAPPDTTGDPWEVPSPGSCAPAGGLRGWPIGQDAPPVPFAPGDLVELEKAPLLESYLPPEVWAQREKLFYEGMRLEIGPCFRDYSPPDFFRRATERFRGEARLLENGGLEHFTAGLPFAPGAIDADESDAGQKWAWNAAHRYSGSGFRGAFRVVDVAGPGEPVERFEGRIFKVQLAYRADRPEDGYRAPGAREQVWAAGGELLEPFDAREYAWRQYRGARHEVDPSYTDEIQVYVPERRRVRRASAANVEGLYLPSFALSSAAAAGTLGFAAGQGGGAPVSRAAGTPAERRTGFQGLELRPLLHRYRVLGLQDVLAPINAKSPAFPEDEERDFGPWGLSFASDRWELRRALVLEGAAQQARGPDDEIARFVRYLDLQTLQPLYYVAYDDEGATIEVGQFVGRWSGDRSRYPVWPDDPERPVRVIDPVGATLVSVSERGGSRRESWNVVSVPPSDRRVRGLLSVQSLTQQR